MVKGGKGAVMIALPIIGGLLTGGIGGIAIGLFGSAIAYKVPTEVRNLKKNILTVPL